MGNLYDLFVSPNSEYRGKPLWSWNGKLELGELMRQLHILKEMGFGGFFMHSRTGLETEYLGEEWFQYIRAAAEEGAKLGLEPWLYDEDRWPSGTAGGVVTEEPRYRMKSLQLRVASGNSFRWGEGIVAAYCGEVTDDINLHEYMRIDEHTDAAAYWNRDVMVFTVKEQKTSSFYNGNTYLDTLNLEATEAFLQSTHEKYKAYCGDLLGKVIKGIFIDEPHRGGLMDGLWSPDPADEWVVPWTYTIIEQFKEMFGYDLRDRLPELFLRLHGEAVSPVKWQYTELLQQMFLTNFAQPVQAWCQRNGIVLAGHIWHEDSLAAQTAVSGSMMRYYEYMDAPGVDVLGSNNRRYWIVKQLASAARQLGKPWLLSELYGCSGWQSSFEDYKQMGDWQALFGINVRSHHLSWYSMKGESKRDYPASIFYQSAWWRDFQYVEDYFSRIGVVMSQGKAVCDTLVINPVESVWCQIYPGWSENIGIKNTSSEVKVLQEDYESLFAWLTGAHIDFDYGDEEMLTRLGHIEHDLNGDPIIRVGEAAYRQVVVSGLTTIRSTTLKLIERFLAIGGHVVFAGEPPAYVDALHSDAAKQWSGKSLHVPFEQKALVSACTSRYLTPITITNAHTGEGIDHLFCQLREDKGNHYLMVLNVDPQKAAESVKISLIAHGFVEQWNCENGDRMNIHSTSSEHGLEWFTTIPPGGERIYMITCAASSELPYQTGLPAKTVRETVIHGPYAYQLDEPNVCVLDRASLRIDDGEWQTAQEIIKLDQTVRRHFGLTLRGGEMLQPWYREKLQQPNPIFGKITCRFSFEADYIPETGLELALEQPEFMKLRVNGVSVELIVDQNRWWVDRCFHRVPLPVALISIGKNEIELEVDFHEKVDLEAIYLLGPFGVRLQGFNQTLVRLPETLTAGSITEQGLPFYSGKITYQLYVPISPKPGERVFLKCDGYSGACVRINAEKGLEQMIAWQPYEADITDRLKQSLALQAELTLTRRNSFGPLHMVPAISERGWYGPGEFITEGEQYSDDYQLIPTGFLLAPRVQIR